MDLEGRIKVSELHAHPQNEYYFDDMTGDNWDELIRSITTSGVTNAITITQEKVIISGHQRVRACKVLGIDEVSYKMIQYDDEREEIKDLIESNLRQRVLANPNPIKMGRCFNFLNGYYGFEHGGNRKSRENNFPLIEKDIPNTQTELEESYGIAKQTMSNYMRLTKAIPELEELVDTGIVTSTTALAIMRNLSENEQISLISSLDTTKKNTQREVQKYIDEIKELKSNPPKPDDYEDTKRKLNDYKQDYQDLRYQFDAKVKELQELRKQMENKENEEPASQYSKKLQNSTLLFCTKVATFIEQVGGYVWLTDEINKIPELEREGYIKSIHAIKAWADTMEFNINNKVKEIN